MNTSWTVYSDTQVYVLPKLTALENPIVFDQDLHAISANGKTLKLRLKIWSLLNILYNNANKLVSRSELIEKIWHSNHYTGERGLTHSICEIRKLLKELELDYKIVTVPKTGYLLKI